MGLQLIAKTLIVLMLIGLLGCEPSPVPDNTGGDLTLLARGGEEFEQAVPGRELTFPRDHGAHPSFRVEWWYLTLNLQDEKGVPYGAQWTLFRTALEPAVGAAAEANPWQNQQIFMAHFAVSTPDDHRAFQRYARGGLFDGRRQAGVDAQPFAAWIDDWRLASTGEPWLPMTVTARQDQTAINLQLSSDQPLVLQGEGGFSAKHASGSGSYYYSHPWLIANGELEFGGETVTVTGQGWLDREWSSQFLQPGQQGWDWMALHLDSGDKLMAFRLRSATEDDFTHGVVLRSNAERVTLQGNDLLLSPLRTAMIQGRELPVGWQLKLSVDALRRLPGLAPEYQVEALHDEQWMDVDFPYWEGAVQVRDPNGKSSGKGYLEMTGYPIATDS